MKSTGWGRLGALPAWQVDAYQGEENDVIILSLVRSNSAGKLGFTAVHNRGEQLCVAGN